MDWFLDDIFGRHEEWIDVFESLELRLVDLSDSIRIIGRELNRFVGELGREIRQISIAFKARPIRRRNLFLLERLPLYRLVKRMSHDLHETGILVAAQTIGRVLVQEALE